MNLLKNLAETQTLAQAIINTIPEPFLVLDAELRVLAASRSFGTVFKVEPDDTRGQLLYALGEGQWDIPALRLLLETIIPERTSMEGFVVEHDFPNVGTRTMLLNARKVQYEDSGAATILLAFHDDTARRAIERDKEFLQLRSDELLQQKQTLLDEIQHRVANSLQIIASILLIKARAVTSDEARSQLKDAHQRVMSIASVQQHLHTADGIDQIEVNTYLAKLCASLAASMVSEAQPIDVEVLADDGTVGSADAVSIGLIVTELLINAVKYAFPELRPNAQIRVAYEVRGTDWILTVADNGVGKADHSDGSKSSGLGTAIVQALVRQLNAQITTTSGPTGVSVAITHATLTSRLSAV